MSVENTFTKEQMDSFRQVFNYLDKTKCGLVSCEKIGELIRLSGFTPTEAEVITLKGNYAEKTGITFNEYIKLISSLDCVVTEEGIRKAFKVFDKYNDGKIKVDLLRNVLTRVGEPLSDREMDNFLEIMDIKDKEYVEYEFLCRELASVIYSFLLTDKLIRGGRRGGGRRRSKQFRKLLCHRIFLMFM